MNMKLYAAIKKSFFSSVAAYLVQFLCLVIYARLFSPQEFGFLASIQVFVVFFQMLSNMGVGPALINEKNVSSEMRNGIFSFTIFIAIFLSLSFYGFSYWLNYFFDNMYQTLAVFVSVSVFFSAISVLPITALNKDTKFISLAKATIIGEVASVIFIITLYSSLASVELLASRFAILAFLRFLLTYYMSQNTLMGRAKIGKGLHHIKVIASFSLYQFGFSFINYFSRNLDNILIGKYLGMTQLGFYQKSYDLMKYPIQLTTVAMNPAIQPVLSKFQSDKRLITNEHNTLVVRLFKFSLPISLFLILSSRDLVLFLFGEEWLESAKVISILALSVPFQIVMSTAGAFFQSINRPKLLFVSGCISAVFNIVAIVLGVSLGTLKDVATLITISMIVNFFQAYFILFKYGFRENFYRFVLLLFITFFKNVPFLGVFYSIYYYLSNDVFSLPFYRLFFLGLALCVVYFAIFYSDCIKLIKKSFTR